jgi:hypothetical protein
MPSYLTQRKRLGTQYETSQFDMKIQDALVGAVSTLLVTVLGGVAVYYATKEPDEKKSEKLVYVLSQTATFTGAAQELAFSTLSVSNEGGIAAKKPTLTIDLKSAEVRDLAVNAQGGSHELSREKSPRRIRITFESLLPRETITLSLLLSQPEKPMIDFRSEASLAEERIALQSTEIKTGSEKLNAIAKIIVPVGAVLSLLTWIPLTIRLRSRGAFDFFSDRNDAGFLLLHQGLVGDAERILSEAVHQGRSDQYVLSNYALCRALAGNFDDADKLLRAATFRDRSGHGLAVVFFNESLIRLKQGDESASMAKLADAIRMSPKAIKKYAEKTVHFDGVRQKPAFQTAINGA